MAKSLLEMLKTQTSQSVVLDLPLESGDTATLFIRDTRVFVKHLENKILCAELNKLL